MWEYLRRPLGYSYRLLVVRLLASASKNSNMLREACVIHRCEAKRQHLFTCKLCKYCLFGLAQCLLVGIHVLSCCRVCVASASSRESLWEKGLPANMRRWPNVGVMLGQHRRQWTDITSTSFWCYLMLETPLSLYCVRFCSLYQWSAHEWTRYTCYSSLPTTRRTWAVLKVIFYPNYGSLALLMNN